MIQIHTINIRPFSDFEKINCPCPFFPVKAKNNCSHFKTLISFKLDNSEQQKNPSKCLNSKKPHW